MSLSTVMHTALSGMHAASVQVEAMAHNLANLQTPDFKPSRAHLETAPPLSGVVVSGIQIDPSLEALGTEAETELSHVDLGRELIELTLAGDMFRANAAVLQVADAMFRELFRPRRY